MSIIEQFIGREAGPLVQFLKYAIAGCIATATHITLFHLAAWKIFPALHEEDWAVKILHLPVGHPDVRTRSRNSMIDNVLAFVVSNLVAYAINILWVFERGRHAWFVELTLFYAVSGASIALGTGIMGFLIRRYGMLTTYAFGANLVTALLINFAVRKFVIFNG